MTHSDDLPEPLLDDLALPTTALGQISPGSVSLKKVVHRDRDEECVFLFEALDDALECARMAEDALGFAPRIGRVRVADLAFRTARFKPATAAARDLPLGAA